MPYLLAFLLLSFLVLVHELGHLLAARAVGMPVAAFSVGLGPKLWSRTWGATEYSLRALPLGGFVMVDVESFEEMEAIPLWRRLIYFLGGPAANLALALPLCAITNLGQKVPVLRALLIGPFVQVGGLIRELAVTIPTLFHQPSQLSGVVGLVADGGKFIPHRGGLEFAILISVSLGLLNLLPIPILDGGQIVLSCLERLFPRFTRLRTAFTLAGGLFLAAVMVYANASDLVRLWA